MCRLCDQPIRCRGLCKKHYDADYYQRTREAMLSDRRAQYQIDPAPFRAASEAWKAENRERHAFLQRRSHLKNLYGLTPERFDALLAAQDGRCGICRRESSKRLQVDHDHSCCPGRRSCGECIRGLLCAPCNRLLGWLDNNRDAISDYVTTARGASHADA